MNPTVKDENAVFCAGLKKSFAAGDSQVLALRGIDLTVRRGDMTMLVGPSGCGKTTLISLIAGILRPDAGSCQVMGVDYAALPPREAIRLRGETVGFIFQSFNLLPVLTVEMNVAIPLIVNGAKEQDALKAARKILDEVGLGNRCETFPPQLSGGQQQRVAIARALVHQPELLVCDEPTSALDHSTGTMVMDMIRAATRARGTTAIIVTHDNRIYHYADSIVHMEDGAITGTENRKAEP